MQFLIRGIIFPVINSYELKIKSRKQIEQIFIILCPAALHTVANISMRIFPISLIFL
jgi:hypothetical protein